MNGLAVVETHPIQYHAPVYRVLQQQFGIPVHAIYGSDFSVVGYRDDEFGVTFSWNVDLLSGYTPLFLSRVSQGGARSVAGVSADGLLPILNQIRPAAVLLVGYSPAFHRSAFLQVRRAGIPILFRGETIDDAHPRSWIKRQIRDQGLRWFYARCAKLLYIGQRSRQHFARLGCHEEKLAFSPYCVDPTPFRWAESDRTALSGGIRRELGIGEQEMVLLFSGKLIPRKRPDLLLQAAGMLSGSFAKGMHLLFMGDGGMREALENQAGRIPSIKAHFLGFQNITKLSAYYHAADALVLPSSHSETWGLVVNEALLHGLPCIVSEAVGCAPDLVEGGRTGELCRTGSNYSLADAIRRVHALTNRPKVREWCRQKVNGYSQEKAAEGIASAYQAVLKTAVPPVSE